MKTITSKKAARLLPGLLLGDNKYTRGLCELVVGDPIYAGAGVLAVMAATRMGAGYVCAPTQASRPPPRCAWCSRRAFANPSTRLWSIVMQRARGARALLS